MTYLSRDIKSRPERFFYRSRTSAMSSREESSGDKAEASNVTEGESSRRGRGGYEPREFPSDRINASRIRQHIMELFSKDSKRPRASQGAKAGEGEAAMGAAGGARAPAREPTRLWQGPYFSGMFGTGVFGAGAAAGSAAPEPQRQIPDYYNERGESTLGKRSASSSRFWDMEYPRQKVKDQVDVFSFKDLQGDEASGRFFEDPWIDLAEVPGHLTRLNITSNFSRHDLTEYIMGGFQTSPDADLSYMHRALNHNIYQIPWGNFLMPALCTWCGAQWMDSFQTNDLKDAPQTMSYRDYERKKKLWVELVKKQVLATSRTDGHHFNACLYVFPNGQNKQGYVIMMDPLGSGVAQLQREFENIAQNLVILKRTVFGDPKVREKRGSLNPADAPPRMRFVRVTHPAHLTQGDDSGCSLWCLLQLAYWLRFFNSSCKGKPDAFCDQLDQLFSTVPHYDFNAINPSETVVDRNATMRSVRRFGLLQLQYMAQAKDAYDCLRETIQETDKKTSKTDSEKANEEFSNLLDTDPEKLLDIVKQRHRGYVQAGSMESVEHYRALCQEFFALHTDEERRRFLGRQTTLDLIRICLKKVFEEGGHDPDSKDPAVQSLIKETLHYVSPKRLPKVDSDIENYRPCKFTNINYNVTYDSEKMKPLKQVQSYDDVKDPAPRDVVSLDLSD